MCCLCLIILHYLKCIKVAFLQNRQKVYEIPERIWEFKKNKKHHFVQAVLSEKEYVLSDWAFSRNWNPFSRIGHSFPRISYMISRIAVRSLNLHNSYSQNAIAIRENEFHQSLRMDSTNPLERIPPIPENGFHQSLRTNSTNP